MQEIGGFDSHRLHPTRPTQVGTVALGTSLTAKIRHLTAWRHDTFTWKTLAAAQSYILVVATTRYGSDRVNSGTQPASQSAFPMPARDGDTISIVGSGHTRWRI
jgi:hypothetical protein